MQTYVVVILVVSLIFLLYVLYLAFFNTSVSNLIDTPYNYKKGGLTISSSNISGMGSAYFSISTWVYIKKPSLTNQNTIFSFIAPEKSPVYSNVEVQTNSQNISGLCPLNNNIPTWSTGLKCPTVDWDPNLALILDKGNSSPNLYLFYRYGNGTNGIPLLITNNFPFQKWTNVIVSFENQTLDVYIDGKLILSNDNLGYVNPSTGNFTSTKFIGNTTSTNILFGGDSTPPDISVTRAAYMPFAMDPQYAMQIYSMGSGVSNNTYNVDLKLYKNNNEIRDIQLY
jgi:hypothetical protein